MVCIAVFSSFVGDCRSLPRDPGIGMLLDTLEPEALSVTDTSSSSSPMENIISCFFAILQSTIDKIIFFCYRASQGCGNTMPDLSDLVPFHSGQVGNFNLLVLGQVQNFY